MKEKVLYSTTADPAFDLQLGSISCFFRLPWTHYLTLTLLLEAHHTWLCTNGSLLWLTIDGTKSLCQAMVTCSVWYSVRRGGPSVPKVDWRTQSGAPCDGEGALPVDCSRERGKGVYVSSWLCSFLLFLPSHLYFCASVVSTAAFVSLYHFRCSFPSAALVVLILHVVFDQCVLYSVDSFTLMTWFWIWVGYAWWSQNGSVIVCLFFHLECLLVWGKGENDWSRKISCSRKQLVGHSNKFWG